MSKVFFILIFFFFISTSFAQKPSISPAVYGKWPTLGNPVISNNGKYTMYTIFDARLGRPVLTMKSTNNDWVQQIPGGVSTNSTIMENSRFAVFMKLKDSLGIAELGTDRVDYISNVVSYKVPKKKTDRWLAYCQKKPSKCLILNDMSSGKRQMFSDVNDYYFSDNGKVLLIQQEVREHDTLAQTLQWVTLEDNKVRQIWKGTHCNNFLFDITGFKIAFIAEDTTLWYFDTGMSHAALLVDGRTPGMSRDAKINKGKLKFSKDGRNIFFTFRQIGREAPKNNSVSVDIWSYSDDRLQSEQLNELSPKIFDAVFNIDSLRVIQLTHDNEEISLDDNETKEWVLLRKQAGNWLEVNWRLSSRSSLYILSILTGQKKLVTEGMLAENGEMSPSGKYIVYYDITKRNYFSYTVSTGITINITKGIRVPLYDEEDDHPGPPPPYSSMERTWTPGDASVILYDRYDVWLVSLNGDTRPIDITNGFGRKNDLTFRLANEGSPSSTLFSGGRSKILLVAFDNIKKFNGFYSVKVAKAKDPEALKMGPFIYHIPLFSSSSRVYFPFPPLKARDKEVYIVRRMDVSEFPNYYSTKDFKSYIQISDLKPEKDFNWIRSELIHWKTLNGTSAEGILYKPEDFDPNKKYPLIFYIYERFSDGLNEYLKPEASTGRIDIPSYVSNGYLLFAPDIRYQVGNPGESIYNSVVSAAKYLSRKPWVDSTKIGIQGHSMGGYEVHYLITHTGIFAAAASAAGATNLITEYGSLNGLGFSKEYSCETGQLRIGSTLWQNPDLYIKNSPIFRAEYIQTPLLMMHNKRDGAVSWYAGTDFFTALRRLGKKVWMLQYDNGKHQVFGNDALDYTTRVFQFFDHYLKGAQPPKWMTEGIPASLKRIDSGLELDDSGKEP